MAFNSLEQSIGVSVIATVVDVHTVMVTIHPSSWNIIPARPESIVRGTNTAQVTSVVAITETQTSFVAYIAASRGLEPRSICLVIFSSTTMASSTTIPMAMVREQREIMFIERPAPFRYMNATIRAIGMVIPIMKVARQRPRKNRTTSTTNRRAYIIDSSSELIEFWMFSEES